ncbi:MAG TPA: DUF4340 domain-containing protein [Candidatus Baltobacteraceae bacterium]|jgi:hypothetical protein|nr:DUF4340 domain-containing protein [Candidatus Baltobacteraceae bacterium]
MNRKQLIMLLVALAVIGGACLVLLNRREQSWTASETQIGQKLLNNFQMNDVASIHIKGDTDLDLEKKDGRWRVEQRGGYPANFSQISELLIKMGDLKVAQSEPIGASQLDRMHLGEPGKGPDAATLLEFKDAGGKVLDSLLLGKKHTQKSEGPAPGSFGDEGFADGRYVMLRSDTQDLLTVSDPLNSVDPKPAQWLDKDFFKVEKPATISFVSTNASNSWTLSRQSESAPWVLADVKPGEVLDTNKVSSLSSTLSYPSIVDVAADQSPAKTGMNNPLTLTIETFDHFTYVLKIGDKTPENDYNLNVTVTGAIPSDRTPGKDEKPDDKKRLDKEFADKTKPLVAKLDQEKALDKWTFVVNSWLIDPLIRDRAQLLVEKKDEKKDAGAASQTTTPDAIDATNAPFNLEPPH